MEQQPNYSKDAYHLLGGVEGVRALVHCFYDFMDTIEEARPIRDMHPKDMKDTRENLALFVCGWLGGPPLYIEKHGSLNITELHSLMNINEKERDMWLFCMEQALEQQEIDDGLKEYLLRRFKVPAEKIRVYCQQQFMRTPQVIKK